MENQKKKPTAKEIAELTGYSVATVSMALNNKGTLSEVTRKVILKAAQDMNYVLPSAASGPIIRLLIEESTRPVLTDPYYGEIIRGIEEESRKLGYEIMLSFVNAGSAPEAWLNGVSGMIVLGSGLISDEYLNRMNNGSLPIVLVDNFVHEGLFPSIHADHNEAGFLATQYLIDQGHRKIGYISGPRWYKTLSARFAGYCMALMQNDIPMDNAWVSPNYNKQAQKGYLEMKYLMELPDRPTAVFACSDKAALGAVKALEDLGMKHGQDVQLMGCDNIDEIHDLPQPIPTVHLPKREVGEQAIRTLVDAIHGSEFKWKIVIPGKLVIPASAGS